MYHDLVLLYFHQSRKPSQEGSLKDDALLPILENGENVIFLKNL